MFSRRAHNYGTKLILPLLFVFFVEALYGQAAPGVAFLRMTAGSQAQGMGDAYTAVAMNANGIYYNPAGMGFGSEREVMLFHSEWFEDISMENITFMYPFTQRWSLAAGVSYLHMPSMTRYEIDPSTGGPLETGTFNVYDMVVTTGFGFRLTDNLSLGSNIKFFQEGLESVTASGFAFDFGLLARLFSNRLGLGLAVQHLGPSVQYIEAKEKLPLTYRAGAALFIPGINGTVALDVVKTENSDLQFLPGVEVSLIDGLYLRGGYQVTDREGNGVTAGVGLNFLNKHRLNYVYVPYGDLGDTHRAELIFNLGSPEIARPTYNPPSATRAKPADQVRVGMNEVATRNQVADVNTPSVKLTVPGGVQLLKVSDDKIKLRWNPVAADVRYNVYARPVNSSKWIKVTSDPIDQTSQTFSPRKTKLELEFVVTAVRGDDETDFSTAVSTHSTGNSGAAVEGPGQSTVASATSNSPQPAANFVETEAAQTVMPTPKGLRLVDMQNNKLKLAWAAHSQAGVKYFIYARPQNSTRWIRVTSEPIAETFQIFNKKQNGVALEFAVTAFYNNEESDFSDSVKLSR